MEFRFIHHFWICLALAALFLLALGCESPVSGDRPENANDPKSEIYEVREISGIQISPEPDGSVIIKWQQSSSAVDLYLIEKSLGNDSSYVEIGRVPKTENQFSDNTGEIRGETHYRVTSLYSDGSEETIIDQNSNRLEFGTLKNFTYEILEDENKLRINWESEHPLITHFRIQSDKNISGEKGEPLLIESGQTKNFFVDELSDISFSNRHYEIEAIIKGDGFEDIAIEAEYLFDPSEFFGLEDFRISTNNERDWILEWEDNVFFAEFYRITKFVGGDIVAFIVPGAYSAFTDTTIVVTERTSPNNNRIREYRIEVLDAKGGQSQYKTRGYSYRISAPRIDWIGGNNFDNSISLELYNIDSYAVQLIIERAEQENFRPLEFEIIATLDPAQTNFTDYDLQTNKTYHYRVRTLTSTVYKNVAMAYQEVYDVTSTFTWDISYPARIESTPDGRFIAWIEEIGLGHTVKVFDLLNNQYHSEIVTDATVRITDIKITPDEEFIYFAAPDERAIYRAEFPSGEKVARVIENTDRSNNQFGFGIGNIDISPDGNLIAGTGGIGHFAMYDREDYSRIYTYSESGSHSSVTNINIAFSPVDDLIVINSNNQISLHNIADGSLEMMFPANFSSDQLGFSNEGSYVYTRDFGYAQIFNINDGSEYRIWGGYINSEPGNDDKLLLGRQFIDFKQGRYTGAVGEIGVNSRVLGQTESILKYDFRDVNIWSKTGVERWNYLYEYQYRIGGFYEPHSR